MSLFFQNTMSIAAHLASIILLYFFPQHIISPAVKGAFTPLRQDAFITTIPPAIFTSSPSAIQKIVVTVSKKPVTKERKDNLSLLFLVSPSSIPSITHYASTSVMPTFIFPSETPSPTLAQTENSPSSLLITPVLSPAQSVTTVTQNSLNPDRIFDLVNTYRISHGLLRFQKDDRICAIAKERSAQVYNEIFVTGALDAGLAGMHLPFFVTENIIYDDTEQNAVNWWLNDSTHLQIITGNYTYSCVACSGLSCAQIFTSYIPK